MLLIQEQALTIIERSIEERGDAEAGFQAVRIEDIARVSDVGVASVYRYFRSKERVVLWDEYDPALLERFREALKELAPARALARAVELSVSEVYQRDKKRILRRARLVMSVPSLVAASAADAGAFRAELSSVLLAARWTGKQLHADCAAAALVGVLTSCIEAWVRGGGRRSLATLVEDSFEALELVTTAPARRTSE